MARVTKSDIFRSAPLEFLCMMRMFVLGFEFYKRVMNTWTHHTTDGRWAQSTKKWSMRQQPERLAQWGHHGRMKLMILNPGAGGNGESAAPLYERFFCLDVHRCSESGYESQSNCEFVTRTIMVADITDCRLCV